MNSFPTRARRGQCAPTTPIALFCALLAAALVATPWSPATAQDAEKTPDKPSGEKTDGKKEVVVIKTTMGTIVFELLPDVAPKMVENFKDLATSKFYDGTTFHRVIPNFMIQGGDPLSKDDDPNNDGTGDGPRKMQAEFTTKYSHDRGIVSTARSQDPNSGSCQFFIMHKKSPHLDNKYTIFGRVIEGIEVVDKIVAVPTGRANRPVKNVVMESVTIELR
jgi:peptidyl-prolyl cis-trans isomerase B (cyclophilin B)